MGFGSIMIPIDAPIGFVLKPRAYGSLISKCIVNGLTQGSLPKNFTI